MRESKKGIPFPSSRSWMAAEEKDVVGRKPNAGPSPKECPEEHEAV